MFKTKSFELREYQKNIHETCKHNNTLVCLPTGTGKTKTAIALSIDRLNKHKNSKIIICSPTKPLAAQICKEFKDCTTIPEEKIELLTGIIKPEERKNIFNKSLIIVATPQTIENDFKNKRIDPENVSLLVIDECHKSKERFANTLVAKLYMQKAKNKRILALTASPGSTDEKVNQIVDNLFIEAVEIRNEDDEDMQKHIQDKSLDIIKIDLPKEYIEISKCIKSVYNRLITQLRYYGVNKPASVINKKDLLMLQKSLQMQIKSGNYAAYQGISLVAGLIKLSYLIELIETQSLNSMLTYHKKLMAETSKAAKNIRKEKPIVQGIKKAQELVKKGKSHPKLEKIKEIVKEELKDTNKKIIIFSNYRALAEEIKNTLDTIKQANPTLLIGQKSGLTQKEQIQVLEDFNKGKKNIIIATSIGEEGLSINELDLAIFYDHTASEIRKIQRSGRVGRVKPGKIIYIVANKTRDEGLMWAAQNKEKKMHRLLNKMKSKLEKQQE